MQQTNESFTSSIIHYQIAYWDKSGKWVINAYWSCSCNHKQFTILQLNVGIPKFWKTAIIATCIEKNCSPCFLWVAKGSRRMKNDWRTRLHQKKNGYWKSLVCLLCTKVRQCYKLFVCQSSVWWEPPKAFFKETLLLKEAFFSTLNISSSWSCIITSKYKKTEEKGERAIHGSAHKIHIFSQSSWNIKFLKFSTRLC